jgi:hypothetical protein
VGSNSLSHLRSSNTIFKNIWKNVRHNPTYHHKRFNGGAGCDKEVTNLEFLSLVCNSVVIQNKMVSYNKLILLISTKKRVVNFLFRDVTFLKKKVTTTSYSENQLLQNLHRFRSHIHYINDSRTDGRQKQAKVTKCLDH